MAKRRQPIPRSFASKNANASAQEETSTRHDLPRRIRNSIVDFTTLSVPPDVRLALAEAFWGHYGIQSEAAISSHWFRVKTFDRFARESGAVRGLADLNRGLLVRYIEWLNTLRNSSGKPWAKSTRSGAYTVLRKLLQWLERCRPGTIESIEYHYDPFTLGTHVRQSRSSMPASELRAILRVCEADIAKIRTAREVACAQRAADNGKPGTFGWLLDHIDQNYGGVLPTRKELSRTSQPKVLWTLRRLGGLKQIEYIMYPCAESLLPYYLVILIHAAGNVDPIAELERDCLQSLPLLDNRQALVWYKARAHSIQRRTFSSTNSFEPPALVREIIEWNERLRPLVPVFQQSRLFLYKSYQGVTALVSAVINNLIKPFCERHGLPRFTLGSIRPGVLASFYRASGDLRRVSAIANHAHLSTTVRYVQTPEVEAQNRTRIAALQSAFIGHILQDGSIGRVEPNSTSNSNVSMVPRGEVVSMFGFGCTDPLSGIAPGTHRGELCTNFMGCFTCPNAIITPDPPNRGTAPAGTQSSARGCGNAARGPLAGVLCPAVAHP